MHPYRCSIPTFNIFITCWLLYLFYCLINLIIMIKIPRQYGYREPEFSEISFLSIKSYSEHPEVYKAAELLFKAFKDSRTQIRNEPRYLRDARKLIASIWMHAEDKFRFTTKNSYFSKTGRKQVWMTNRILDLFESFCYTSYYKTRWCFANDILY